MEPRSSAHHSSRLGKSTRRTALGGVAGLLLNSCTSRNKNGQPTIAFSRIPRADEGGRDRNDIIEGHVTGALPGDQIVLYARSGNWWVQPIVDRPFTPVQGGSNWTNATHLGSEYAALLVRPGFQPPANFSKLPEPGGLIAAVASVKGAATSPSPPLRFSGYDWRLRNANSRRGGRNNSYDPKNAWTDPTGALHLRIAKTSDDWNCAEVSCERSLGYGTYSFTVRDISQLEPAAVFSIFTYDYARADQNFGEMSLEISRWGDPTGRNAQYLIQPYYVPANVFRFSAPSGALTHQFRWEPGRITFRTWRGRGDNIKAPVVAEYTFTSGAPVPGIESVRMSLFIYESATSPFKDGAEVVVEKFEYLP